MPKFYSIKKYRAKNGTNIGRIDIYGDICALQFWGDEVTPSSLADELKALGAISEIEVHIFSGGGDLFASLAIYQILKSRPEKVSVYIEGVVASGATIITCAGDIVYMPNTAMMFVHNMITKLIDVNEHDIREALAEIEKMKEPYVNAYIQKTGKSRDEVIALLDGENKNGTWLTADEAIAFGLVDAITPVEKQPLEMAACISPGVFSYKGQKIDCSQYEKAAEKTANILGGDTMGIFNGKKKVAAKTPTKPKAEIVFVEMVCPNCSGKVNLNPENGEIFAGGEQTEPQTKPEDNKEPQASVFARRIPGNVRASIYSVNCPHCGNDFVWDTDVNADGAAGTTATETTPIGGKQEPAQQQTQQPAQEPSAEMAQAVCPECNAQFEYDTEASEKKVDEATGQEGYLITCPECNVQFIEPLESPEPDAVPTGMSAKEQAAYRAGVMAERNRQLALDEMLAAAPDTAGMIQAAKASGASAETMSRNVIRAMANGKGGTPGAQKFAASLKRDVAASGVNSLRTPNHASKPKSIFEAAYEKYAAEYNKGRGGKENGKA